MSKFKCIEDKEDTAFFGTKMEKISGLTKGKIYSGSIFSENQSSYTSRIQIVIFDDNGEWETYDPECFVPGEE